MREGQAVTRPTTALGWASLAARAVVTGAGVGVLLAPACYALTIAWDSARRAFRDLDLSAPFDVWSEE